GWGVGGNPVPAGTNGLIAFGANNDTSGIPFALDQDEVWMLSPSPLIEFGSGYDANADTPTAAVGEKILDTNAGKTLGEYNQNLRSYSFQIGFSGDDIFAGATLYAEDDLDTNGASEHFADGIHDLSKTTIGANAASSIKVEPGFVAYLCNGSMDLPEECTLYAPGSYNDLGTMDDSAIYIKVDQNDPTRHGRWGDVFAMSQRAIAAAQLPDKKIMFWEGEDGVGDGKPILIFDPDTMQEVANFGAPMNHDTFCPGPALLTDGDLILAGGGSGTENASSVFDWQSTTWNREENMDAGHYYGTTVALADGRAFHALGSTTQANNSTDQSNIPEIWTGTGWEALTEIDVSALHASNGYYNSNYYPFLHLMPTSNLFHSGGVPNMHEINPNAMEIHDQGIRAGDDVYRHWGNAIMVDEGILFISGGRTEMAESMRSTVLIDINDDLNIQSSYKADMHYDRAFHNMVQLPTGDIFVSGGNSSGKIFQDYATVYASEMYNRTSDSWSLMAPHSTPRNYHSTSLLLADGRVWQAGGDCGHCVPSGGSAGFNHHYNGQFYSPPYLFDENGDPADRPKIETYPDDFNEVKASQSFNVTLSGSGADSIANFNIIRMSSTTHQMNTDVRRLSLDFTNNSNGSYTIDAHDNINVMTPGYWMLFAVNQDGVPSEAAIIHVSTDLGNDNPSPSPKPVVLGNGSTGLGGIDGFSSNLIINLTDIYTNQSGSAEDWYLTDFKFYAGDTGGPVTPFIVTINGSEDYTVKAIGTSRTPATIGAQSFSFEEGTNRKITIASNETIAIGFIDANADGTPSGNDAKSIIARNSSGSANDDIYYVGHSNANLIVTFEEGQAPVFIDTQYIGTQFGPRDYAFSISMVDSEPDPATPTPEPTNTPTSTPPPGSTSTPTPTVTNTPPPGSTATFTPTPTVTMGTPMPTETPDPTGGGDEKIYLPLVTR
ncbi:MAG: galactose oxidase early set domain-containing protein, partial [Chloroflexota bacterium]